MSAASHFKNFARTGLSLLRLACLTAVDGICLVLFLNDDCVAFESIIVDSIDDVSIGVPSS